MPVVNFNINDLSVLVDQDIRACVYGLLSRALLEVKPHAVTSQWSGQRDGFGCIPY
jgi:hypothetical protein